MSEVENTGGPFRIIDTPNKMILQIHDDGTVELGEGVSLDDASKAFWEYVQVHGPKARLAQALSFLKEFEDIYMATGYERAYDNLHDRIIDYLDELGQ